MQDIRHFSEQPLLTHCDVEQGIGPDQSSRQAGRRAPTQAMRHCVRTAGAPYLCLGWWCKLRQQPRRQGMHIFDITGLVDTFVDNIIHQEAIQTSWKMLPMT